MKIRRLILKNIYNYSNVNLKFPRDNNVILVYGIRNKNKDDSIGIGKSNLFESISWTLFADDQKGGSVYNVIKYGSRKCGSICFIGNHKVTRIRSNKKRLIYDGRVYKYDYGKNYIYKKWGMCKEIWDHVIYYSQLDVSRFILATTSEKKRFLSLLFLLNLFEKCYEESKQVLNEYVRLSNKCDGAIDNARNLLRKFKIRKRKMLKKSKVNINRLNVEQVELRDLVKKLRDTNLHFDDMADSLKSKIYKIENDTDKLKNILLYNECPTCTSIISNELKDNIKKKLSIQLNILSQHKRRYIRLCKKCDRISKKLEKMEDKLINYNNMINREKMKVSTQVEYPIQDILGDLKVLKHKRHKYSVGTNKYSKITDVFHKDGFVSYYITNIIASLNRYLKEDSRLYDLEFYPQLDEDKLNIIIHDNMKIYELNSRSGGEKRLVSIMLFLAFYKMYRKINEGNPLFDFVILDEPLAQLDRKHISSIMAYLEGLAKDLKITIFMITNDQYIINQYVGYYSNIIIKENKGKVKVGAIQIGQVPH